MKPKRVGAIAFNRLGLKMIAFEYHPDRRKWQPGARVNPAMRFNVAVNKGNRARTVVIKH